MYKIWEIWELEENKTIFGHFKHLYIATFRKNITFFFFTKTLMLFYFQRRYIIHAFILLHPRPSSGKPPFWLKAWFIIAWGQTVCPTQEWAFVSPHTLQPTTEPKSHSCPSAQAFIVAQHPGEGPGHSPCCVSANQQRWAGLRGGSL